MAKLKHGSCIFSRVSGSVWPTHLPVSPVQCVENTLNIWMNNMRVHLFSASLRQLKETDRKLHEHLENFVSTLSCCEIWSPLKSNLTSID